jgi:predicted nucleic acid-binding protein
VNLFAETSFLCALCRKQSNSDAAIALVAQLNGTPLFISELVEVEFRASIELQVFLYNRDKTKGYNARAAREAMAAFDANIAAEGIKILPCEWRITFARAKTIVARYARPLGVKTLDIIHVATALHLNFDHFASFDTRQRVLAQHCGLNLLPATVPSPTSAPNNRPTEKTNHV